MRSALLLLAFPLVLTAPAAQALEPFKSYDRFTDPTIDPSRWYEGETVRVVKNGALQQMQRTWGLGTSDNGVSFGSWHTTLTQPQTITAMKARITVTALETSACPTNPSVAAARARIFGGFFNVGTPTFGSMTGDVTAQVRLIRLSNSSDPPGVLRVEGIVQVCQNPDCNSASVIGNIVDLGTVEVGTPTTVQMQWDKPGKTFYFAREGVSAGTVAYAESDASMPGVLFRNMGLRSTVPSCLSAPRVSSLVDAKFDNVSVNRSALP